jgi:murein DD-endopeptidase
MNRTRLLALFLALLLLLPTQVFAGDPRPPQLSVSFLAEPAPIVQYGATKLAYEMVITNFSRRIYVIDSISATAGETPFTFSNSTLAAMIVHLGGAAAEKKVPAVRTIAGGASVIVFFLLDLGESKAASHINHSLHVLDENGEAHDVVPAPLSVEDESPIVVAPPLRGDWIAGDSLNNGADAAHRRAVLIEDGHPWLSQRYAIDWVQMGTVNGTRTMWKGPEDRNESYFCYDQPIYSAAAGKVVDMADDLKENVPHSGTYAYPIGADNAAGNHVVVEIAPRRYALYAHMRPGTVRVKTGDLVGVGDLLGRVGNTGSSTEPHMHMHIDNRASFLAGNSVPYEFNSFDASGPVDANVSSPNAISFGEIGAQRPFKNDYPANNALVTFK